MSVLPVIVVLLYPSLANDRRQTYSFFLRCILGWICIIVYLGFSTWTLCTTWPRASYRFWCHTGPMLPWGYSQCTARMVVARQMSLNLACKMLQTESELFNMCHLRYSSEIQRVNELISSEGPWSQEGWRRLTSFTDSLSQRYALSMYIYICMYIILMFIGPPYFTICSTFGWGPRSMRDISRRTNCK